MDIELVGVVTDMIQTTGIAILLIVMWRHMR